MGHFRPGFSPNAVGDFVKQERYSVLAGMDITGIVASHTVPNAFNNYKHCPSERRNCSFCAVHIMFSV